MVATPETRASQAAALIALQASAGAIRVTEFDALVAVNFPTASVRTSLAPVLYAGTSTGGMSLRTSQGAALVAARDGEALRTSQAAVLVAARGRVDNPKLRAWTFTLDGHDFYVLRLGLGATLVYDDYSEQWMDWDAFEKDFWPVNMGINWVDGTGMLDDTDTSYGSNVLIGDDSLGLLWFLDPNQPFDESFDGPLDPEPAKYFPRVLQGQVPINGREVLPCYAVWLTTDMGDPAYDGASVLLEISDDAGKNYYSAEAIEINLGTDKPELSWYSLGQIEAPGRLFRITDDGAVARIDAMEMNDPDDED